VYVNVLDACTEYAARTDTETAANEGMHYITTRHDPVTFFSRATQRPFVRTDT